MFNSVENRITSLPNKKSLKFFVLAAALLIVGGILWTFRASVPLWLGFIVFCFMGYKLVRHTLALGISLRFFIIRKVMRGIKNVRKMCEVSKGIQFLHASAFLIIFGAMLVLLATKDAPIFQTASVIGMCILALTAIYELFSKINKLVQNTWAKALGKLFSLTIGAAILYSSTALAKHFVYAVTHVNPKYFLEFTSIFAVLLLPLLYLILGAALLGLWALLQLVMLFGFMLISVPVKFLTDSLGKTQREIIENFWYRIRMGKKSQVPQAALPTFFFLHLFLRPVSVIAAILVLCLPIEWLGKHDKFVSTTLKETLIFLEYHTNKRCNGLPDNIQIAYLDNGQVSTVAKENDTYNFDIKECKIAK